MHAEYGQPVVERFTIPVNVTIRMVTREDLERLEWHGMFTHHREILHAAFERHRKGTNVMLVADVNRAPVGQVWIDMEKKAQEKVGVLWAVRVFPWFQNMRIGARLLAAAERILRHGGFRIAELGVEKENLRAKRFYERNGYTVVGEEVDSYVYTTLSGWREEIHLDEWLMQKSLTSVQVGRISFLTHQKQDASQKARA